MKLHNTDEENRIKTLSLQNDKFEELFTNARHEWAKKIEPLFNIVRGDFSSADSDRIIESQALSLSYRQELQEEISKWLNRVSRENSNMKELKAQKFLFYSTGFGLKTNTSEKAILIDSNIRENLRTVEILQNYIQYLREMVTILESLGYSIKNIIELLAYLGK